MDEKRLRSIVNSIKTGALSQDKAVEMLKELPYRDLGFAKIDHHRAVRKGFPEVIYGKGKKPAQIRDIALRLHKENRSVLITRVEKDAYNELQDGLPVHHYNEDAGTVIVGELPAAEGRAVPVLTAGTGDIPVAEEAAETLRVMKNRVTRIYDAGVSGIHRFLSEKKKLSGSRVIIVVAGMDGVLPSVVGGMMPQPVIAVPTSCGYGADFGGIAPLLTILNSCAPGVVAVNIDNGFGAGYAASVINKL